MVLKHEFQFIREHLEFENDVEMYGAQTVAKVGALKKLIENDVEMYGAQT